MLIKNSALEKFISFGNNLIFEQASTYTGLLFLHKSASETFKYYEFDNMPISDLPSRLKELADGNFTTYEIKDFSDAPWVLN